MTQNKAILTAVSAIPIAPAIYVNIEAMQGAWAPFAIGSVIFAAMLVMLTQEKRSVWFGALAFVFISINLATALGNVASISDDARDGRSEKMEHKAAVDARRSSFNSQRRAQVGIAGEDAVLTIEGQLKAMIASDATRYKASEHCNPDKINRTETKAFCDQIAQLEAKKGAAIERDKIDAKLSEVDKETVFGGPTATDPYAERLAQFLTLFNFQADAECKKLLAASRDWGRAIGLELMAAFGPMALMLFFQMLRDDVEPPKLAPAEPANALAVAYPRRDPAPEPPKPPVKAPEIALASVPDSAVSAVEKAEAERPAQRPRIVAQRDVLAFKRVESKKSFTMDDIVEQAFASLPRGAYRVEEMQSQCRTIADRIATKWPGAKLPKKISPGSKLFVKHGAVSLGRPKGGDRLVRFQLHGEVATQQA